MNHSSFKRWQRVDLSSSAWVEQVLLALTILSLPAFLSSSCSLIHTKAQIYRLHIEIVNVWRKTGENGREKISFLKEVRNRKFSVSGKMPVFVK